MGQVMIVLGHLSRYFLLKSNLHHGQFPTPTVTISLCTCAGLAFPPAVISSAVAYFGSFISISLATTPFTLEWSNAWRGVW